MWLRLEINQNKRKHDKLCSPLAILLISKEGHYILSKTP